MEMKTRIGKKLLLSYCVLVVITLLLVALFLTHLLNNYLVTAQKNQLLREAEEIVSLTGKYFRQEIDSNTFNQTLENINRINDSRVMVINQEGQIIAPNQLRPRPRREDFMPRGFQRGTRLSREEVGQVLSGQIVAKEGTLPDFNTPVISVAIPVLTSDSGGDQGNPAVAGAVLSFSPVYLVTDLVKKVGYYLTISSIMAIFLAIVIALYFSKKIASPLKRMNEAALAMAQGEYKKEITPVGNDELGELATSMNFLAKQLDLNISALEQEKGKLEAVMSSISGGLVAVDRDCRVMIINPLMEKFFMTAVKNIIGKQLSSLSQIAELNNTFTESLAKEEIVVSTFRLVHSTYQITVSPIRQENGTLLGAVGILQDISETEKVEQMRRDFISNVSHELRAPLTVIKGFTDCLLDGVTQQPPTYYHKIIKEETLRLERLINDIMELSLLQAGKVQLEPEEVDLASLVRETVRKFMLKATEKGICLETNTNAAPSGMDTIFCDADRIEQLLVIFLDNALKFTPQGGTVSVNLWEDAGQKKVYLSIKDSGIGIPAEEIPYIWERFYKVDKSRNRRKEDGTGLGLFIAKQIADLHQAEISVESTPQEGTTFTLAFKRG